MRLPKVIPALLALAVTLAAGCPQASATASKLRLRVAPHTVTAGGTIAIAAGVSPSRAICAGSAAPNSGARITLKSKRAVAGQVSWIVRVPTSAASGRWLVSVRCGAAGSASSGFTVKAESTAPPPPPVVPAAATVTKSGVSCRLSSIGSEFCGWGVVIQNTSPDQDAVSVTVLVNLLDAAGVIVESDSDTIAAIPSGVTYYDGGEAIYSGADPATHLTVTTQIATKQTKSIGGLPPVSNMRWSEDFLGINVAGQFMNPYTQSLSGLARIGIVCFDSAGNVLAGDGTYPPADIAPGGSVAFSSDLEGSVSLEQIASCQASVEPETA